MSAEQDIYYRTLQEAKQKGLDDHTARKLAYLASQGGKTETKPKKGRKKK